MRIYIPLATFFAFALPSFGQTYTWDGGGSDDNFGTGANWNPDGAPGVGSGVVLNFTGGTRPTPNNNYTTGDNFGEWRLTSGASTGFTIGGNGFGLFGKLEVDSGLGQNLTVNTAGIFARDAGFEINPVGGNITIGSGTPIELDGNATLNVYDGNNSRTLTINGTLSNGNGTGGNGTLVLNQTSTVVLTGSANDYGNTTINSGTTLRIGDGSANGSLGSGTVSNSGTLIFNRGSGSSYTQDKTINGTGTFRVQSGTVVGSGAAAFGANGGKVDVLSGGTINLNGVSRGANDMTYTIAGTGNGGVGAITNTGTDIYEQAGILNLTLSGNASVGGNNGRFDIGRSGSEYGSINGGGFTLTKIGSNAIVVRTTASNISYVVDGGFLTGEDNDAALGSTGVTVNSGASLGTYGNRTYSVPVTLNAGASMHNNGGGTGIWSGTVNLAGNATANAGSGDIRYTGVVSGSGTLSKTGANWLLLTNAGNTFSGGVNVSGGYLRFNGDGALGTAPGSPATNITLQSGGRIQAGTDVAGVNATLNANRSISLPSGDGYFHVWTGFTMNVPGAISGSGNLRKSDGGTLNYSGTGTITGEVNVDSGTFQLSGGSLTGMSNLRINPTASSSGTLNITGGTLGTTRLVTNDQSTTQSTINHSAGTFNITGSVNSATSSSFLLNHWGNGSSSSTYNLSGGVLNAPNAPLNLGWDGTARLIQTGGTANLQGINFNNGRNNAATYQLTSGRLNIGSYGMNGNASAKWLQLNGGTLGAYANWTGGQQINVSATSTIDTLDSVDGVTGRTITLNGNLSGTGGITKVGAGTLVLGGSNNTYAGATLLSAGTMRLNSGSGRGSSSYTASPGTTLELNGVNIFVGGHGTALADSRTLTINNATLLMTGNTDTRLGNIVLNNGSTWTSDRVLTNYDALLANTDAGAATVSVTGTGASIMNGTGGIHLQGVQNFNVADVTSSSATDLTVSMRLDNPGTIGGAAGGINKTGLGTMVLANSGNSYQGTTRVTNGLLIASVGGALPDFSTVEMADSATAALQINATEQVGSLAGGGSSGGNIALGSGVVLITGNNNNSDTYGGVISGAGASLIKTGGGNQTLTGNSTFTGGVTIQSGTITVPFVAATGTPQPLGTAGSAVTFTGTGSLVVTGSGTLDRGLVLANAANSVSAGGTVTQSGPITGGGSSATFTKSGAGTFNQSGAGSWNSDMNVTAGTYNVTSTGSIAGVGVVGISGGSTMNIDTSTQVRASSFNLSSGTLNLNAGTLRTNGITVAGGSAFGWGAGTLTVQTANSGNSGSTDRTGDNGSGGAVTGPTIYEGTQLTIDNGIGNTVATSNGSVLDLGGLYTSGGLRYNQLRVTGTLNLNANDTLHVAINPYLLRPTSADSVVTGDWGTLVLVHADTITGSFNTITGVSSDMIGWTQMATEFDSGRLPSTLGLNEWMLEYRTGYGPLSGGDVLLLHYRVAGSVPEPASAGLLVAGALLLRALGRRKP